MYPEIQCQSAIPGYRGQAAVRRWSGLPGDFDRIRKHILNYMPNVKAGIFSVLIMLLGFFVNVCVNACVADHFQSRERKRPRKK